MCWQTVEESSIKVRAEHLLPLGGALFSTYAELRVSFLSPKLGWDVLRSESVGC